MENALIRALDPRIIQVATNVDGVAVMIRAPKRNKMFAARGVNRLVALKRWLADV